MNRTLTTAALLMTLLVMGATYFLGSRFGSNNAVQAANLSSPATVAVTPALRSQDQASSLKQAYDQELARQTQRIREAYQKQLDQELQRLREQYQAQGQGRVTEAQVQAMRQQYEQQLQALQNAYAQREAIYQAQLQEAVRRLQIANARIQTLSQQANRGSLQGGAPSQGQYESYEHEGGQHDD